MATYILRDIPNELWERVKARKNLDSHYLRPLLLQLLDDYATGLISPSRAIPVEPQGIIRIEDQVPRPITLKTAFVKLFDGDRTVRIPNVRSATDDGARLELRGVAAQLGEFSKRDVRTWWLEDDDPKTA